MNRKNGKKASRDFCSIKTENLLIQTGETGYVNVRDWTTQARCTKLCTDALYIVERVMMLSIYCSVHFGTILAIQ